MNRYHRNNTNLNIKLSLMILGSVTFPILAHPGINNFQQHSIFDQKLKQTYDSATETQRALFIKWQNLYKTYLAQVNNGKNLNEQQLKQLDNSFSKLTTYVLVPVIRAQYLQLRSNKLNINDQQLATKLHKQRLRLINSFYQPNSYFNIGLTNSWNQLFKQKDYRYIIDEYVAINNPHLLHSELSCLAGSAMLESNQQTAIAHKIFSDISKRQATINDNCLSFFSKIQNSSEFANSVELQNNSLAILSYSDKRAILKLQQNTIFTSQQQRIADFILSLDKKSINQYHQLQEDEQQIAKRNLSTIVKSSLEDFSTENQNINLKNLLAKFATYGFTSEEHRITIINSFFSNRKNLPQETYYSLIRNYPTDRQIILIIRNQLRNNQPISEWLDLLSPSAKNNQEWRYWIAKSAGIDSKLGKEALIKLSSEVGFYPMLAAKQLNQNYAPSYNRHQELDLDKELPWFNKAISELYKVNDLQNASRLWQTLSLNQQGVGFIVYAYKKQWFYQGILSSIANRQPTELQLRFPNAHATLYQQATKDFAVSKSFAQAIGRQESSYYPLAVSSAKAYGVMQMINTTASSTAKLHKIAYAQDKLLDLNYNIRLGSMHLSDLYKRFKHNRVYVAVAYNAGPSRVNTWSRGNLNFDQYIASIPFNETRNYVQNVLTFDFYLRYLHDHKDLTTISDNEWNTIY